MTVRKKISYALLGLCIVIGFFPLVSSANDRFKLQKKYKNWESDYRISSTSLSSHKKNKHKARIFSQYDNKTKNHKRNNNVKYIKEKIKNNPNNAREYARLSKAYKAKKEYSRALEAINKAVVLNPNNIRYLKMRANLAYWLDDKKIMRESYSQLAKVYRARNELYLAMKAINYATILDPNNINYLTLRGSIAYSLDNTPIMKDSYSRILSLQPNNLVALLGMARVNVREENYEKASQDYQTYLKRKPKDKVVMLEYARAKIWEGQYKDAEYLLKEYKQQYGETKRYLMVKSSLSKAMQSPRKESRNIASLKAAIKKELKNASLFFQLSEAYSEKDQFHLALQAINSAVLLDNRNITYLQTRINIANSLKNNAIIKDSYFRLSQIYGIKNEPKLALKAIDNALLLDPNNINYLEIRGKLAYWIDNISVMKDSYSRMLILQPDNPTALLGLARAYAREGQYKRASWYYQAYLIQKPDAAVVQLEYAQIKIWEGEYQAANTILQQYKSQHGETEAYLKLKAQLEKIAKGAGKPADTVDSIKKQIEKDPSNADLYARLSRLYSANNEPRQAFKAIDKAVELDPANVTYLKARGEISYWVDDIPAMKNSYMRILKLQPNNLEAHLGLARAYARKAQYKEATKYYSAYLKEKPKDATIQLEFAQIKIWEGEYKTASRLLEDYKRDHGETKAYLKLKSELAKAIKTIKKQVITIASVQAEIKKHPRDPKLYAQLSQLYSAEKKTKLALQAISKAVSLDPNNINYLKTQGKYAYWADNIPVMKASYVRVLQFIPNDPDALLGLARAQARAGKYSSAANYFQRYLQQRPNDEKVWLDSVSVQIWQENFRKALSILKKYRNHFGVTENYVAYKARVYAAAGWFISALNLNTPLLRKRPNNYYYLITQATAYRNGFQPKKAIKELKKINSVQPDSNETRFMNPYILVPLKTTLNAGGNYLFDSQTVKITHAFAFADIYINPTTYFILKGLQENASASIESGLSPATGGTSTFDTSGSAGLYHRFSPYFAAKATVGALHIKDVSNFVIYNAAAYLNLGERVNFSYEYLRNLYRPDLFVVFSPRSISLAILQSANLFHLFAEPGVGSFINIYGAYANLSDRNRYWELTVWPSVAVIRIDGWKVDLGANADLLSFKEREDNGYFSPLLAQLYLGTVQLYYSIGFNTGFSFAGGLGAVKDETFSNLHLASDLSFQFTWGIYSNWQFILRGSYSYRGNPTSPYHVSYFGVVLTRRI